MEFVSVPVERALGGILAHALRAGETLLRKGRVLSAEDLAVLRAGAIVEVTVARLVAGEDLPEDEAATRIARALAGSGVRIGAAFTGRANLYAESAGLALLDSARIELLNGLDEALTVATLPPFAPVAPRRMIATVKVIPFAAPARAIAAAERMLAPARAVAVAPFRPKRAALVSTQLPTTQPSLLAKNRSAVEARLAPFGSSLVFERQVPHRSDALAEALKAARAAEADPILVFGASAITDRRDVVPAAIVAAGGEVLRFGMPVDPGNLLLLGRLGASTVVGLPSCARSPKTNGFDFVLQRLLADLPVDSGAIAAMGVGGLLSEIRSRPQPRESDGAFAVPQAPHIAAVVLAAGLSSRMGRNKLVAEVGGRPLLRRVVEAALASAARPVIVVTGSEAEAVEAALDGLAITTVRNPHYRQGLSSSLKAGIAAVPVDADGAVVLLGDMPGVTAEVIDKLIAAFDPAEQRAICVATHGHKRGNPVLWSRRFFTEIRGLEGDVGARGLIAANPELVSEVEIADDSPLLDIDTPEALAAYASRAG